MTLPIAHYVRLDPPLDNAMDGGQNDVVDWCDEIFGDGNWWWRDSLDPDYSRRTYFFSVEEDKVKFILRWL